MVGRALRVRNSVTKSAFLARLNRMAERQGRVALDVHGLREFQFLRQEFIHYVDDLARQKAQDRINSSENRKAISNPRT